MDWGNAFVRQIRVAADGSIDSLELELHLDGDVKKTSKKVTWLANEDAESSLTPCLLLDYDFLITKKKLEEDESWERYINPRTEFQQLAWADSHVGLLSVGTIIQFERKGYYRVDKTAGSPSTITPEDDSRVELVFIPDGRAASVALKASVNADSSPVSHLRPAAMYPVKPAAADAVTYGPTAMYAVKPAAVRSPLVRPAHTCRRRARSARFVH